MPWCEDCSKFWSPNSLTPAGECPSCGRTVASAAEVAEAESYKAPWHFKVMVVLAVLYLSWRLIQMISWVV